MKKILPIIFSATIALTANAQSDFMPLTYTQHTFYAVDRNDDGNISHEKYINPNSRIYGYSYVSGSSGTSGPENNKMVIMNIPEGFCMTGEGLPTILPWLTHRKITLATNNTTTQHIMTHDITTTTLFTDTKSQSHLELNKAVSEEYTEDKKALVFNDGFKFFSHDDRSPFFYSVDGGENWIEYTNRDDAHIPNDCSITHFKIEGNSPHTPVFTYNMKITDMEKALEAELVLYPDQIWYIFDAEGNPIEMLFPGETIQLLPDNPISEKCESIPVTISIKEKPIDPPKEENPTPTPTPNTPISTPTPNTPISTPEPSGPSGYIPENPILTSVPIIAAKCQSLIQNLDDAKLIDYYKKLQVDTGLNVNGNISRLDLVRLMVNAGYLNVSENEKEDTNIIDSLADVNKNTWYAPYIAKLIRTGIISTDTMISSKEGRKIFDTIGVINREDAIKILTNIITDRNLRLPTLDEILTFSDVNKTDKNADYIQYAYDACLIHGRKTRDGNPIDGKPRVFEGQSEITIAETAKILFNGQGLRQ